MAVPPHLYICFVHHVTVEDQPRHAQLVPARDFGHKVASGDHSSALVNRLSPFQASWENRGGGGGVRVVDSRNKGLPIGKHDRLLTGYFRNLFLYSLAQGLRAGERGPLPLKAESARLITLLEGPSCSVPVTDASMGIHLTKCLPIDTRHRNRCYVGATSLDIKYQVAPAKPVVSVPSIIIIRNNTQLRWPSGFDCLHPESPRCEFEDDARP